MNTIINFGDYLEEDVLHGAEEHAERSDLVLALGTTLQVSPANDLVEMGQVPIRLVICNRYFFFFHHLHVNVYLVKIFSIFKQSSKVDLTTPY